MDEKKQYEELIRTIDYHMDRYYNQDAPEITDFAYDQLMLQLKAMEKEHPEWVTPDSPTQKVGGTTKREAGVEVVHKANQDTDDATKAMAWINAHHPTVSPPTLLRLLLVNLRLTAFLA